MRNAGLEEAQAGIKIAGRYINNLRYADDTILMEESKPGRHRGRLHRADAQVHRQQPRSEEPLQ